MSLAPNGLPESNTTTKIQVGPNVWIRPNLGQSVPEYSVPYFAVWTDGAICSRHWHGVAGDYSLLNSGNFFITREAAEAAIIKPADTTPITYEQWVEAGFPFVWSIHPTHDVIDCIPLRNSCSAWFAANKRWRTREAAETWRDQWEKENGEVK